MPNERSRETSDGVPSEARTGNEPAPGVPAEGRPFPPRRPWLAFLLAALVPTLGHVYAGVPLRGMLALALWMTVFTALTGWIASLFLGSPVTMLIGGIVLVPVAFAVPIDAAIVAFRRRRAARTRWNRLWIYGVWGIAVMVGVEFSGLERVFRWLDARGVRPFRYATIPGPSMAPTLLEGDYLVLDARAIRTRSWERGDLVVYKYPPAPETEYVKRIVGLPGDTVEIQSGRVYVNGDTITEPSEVDGHVLPAFEAFGSRRYEVILLPREILAPVVVPEGEVFVLGDNRAESADSRVYGTIPLENLAAIPLGIVASRAPGEDPSFRWDRFGKRL